MMAIICMCVPWKYGAIMERLRNDGYITEGKTNTTQKGTGQKGQTRTWKENNLKGL